LEYDYPVFNVADSAIFIGGFFCILLAVKDARREKKGSVELAS